MTIALGSLSRAGLLDALGGFSILFILLTAGAAMAALARVLRDDSEALRRIDYGLCRGCGYDIRNTTDRCPECGRPFKPHEKVRLRADADA